MSNILWGDLETYCEIPITNGTHAYAEGVEVMLFAWAINDGPVNVWDITAGGGIPHGLYEAIAAPETLLYFHNSHFDRTVLRYAMPRLAPPVERWRDTMVQALAHGLPGSLGELCEVLGVPQDKAKDKEGKALIQLFCKPRPKNSKLRRATSKTHPEEWRRFVAYAGLDIEAMREVYKRLPKWNYQGTELALWHRDQQINDRGVCMDVELARAAIDAVDQEQKRLAKRTQEMTDGEVQAATQRDALIKHIVESYGVELPDMQRSTLERRIADPDLPSAVKELLAIRLQASTTSTSKYKALMKGVSHDGRLRGTLQFCGASRTGRWAGRLFQPQNLPRPSLKQEQIDEGIEALKAGCADLLFDNIMELTSSALRGCIIAPTGKKLVVSDLSNIEGRMLAWLAGEEWKLNAFREYDAGTGPDLYKLAYAKAFDIAPDDVDKHMRQIGKVMELGLGYGEVYRLSSLLLWFTVSISTGWRTPHCQTFPAMLSARRKAGTTNRLNVNRPTGFLNGYLSPATHLNVSGAGRIPRPVISGTNWSAPSAQQSPHRKKHCIAVILKSAAMARGCAYSYHPDALYATRLRLSNKGISPTWVLTLIRVNGNDSKPTAESWWRTSPRRPPATFWPETCRLSKMPVTALC